MHIQLDAGKINPNEAIFFSIYLKLLTYQYGTEVLRDLNFKKKLENICFISTQ